MSFNMNEYVSQYRKDKYDKIHFRVYKGDKKIIQEKAAEVGVSVPKLILKALEKQYDLKFPE